MKYIRHIIKLAREKMGYSRFPIRAFKRMAYLASKF